MTSWGGDFRVATPQSGFRIANSSEADGRNAFGRNRPIDFAGTFGVYKPFVKAFKELTALTETLRPSAIWTKNGVGTQLRDPTHRFSPRRRSAGLGSIQLNRRERKENFREKKTGWSQSAGPSQLFFPAAGSATFLGSSHVRIIIDQRSRRT